LDARLQMTGPAHENLLDAEGIVRWFDAHHGYGFIVSPQGEDIFAHYSNVEGAEPRSLSEGCKVVYDAERTDKGWKATRIRRVSSRDVKPGGVGMRAEGTESWAIPNQDKLEKLSIRAQAAFAARCVRRVLPLLSETERHTPYGDAVEALLTFAERAASGVV